MKAPNDIIAVYQQCQSPLCQHSWVDLLGRRDRCIVCGCRHVARPVALQRVSAALARGVANRKLRAEHETLKRAYNQRLSELLTLRSMTDPCAAEDARAIESLTLAFSIAAQLEDHGKALAIAHLVGLALIRRSRSRPLRSLQGFADLETAALWFRLLENAGLLATVDQEFAYAADTCIVSAAEERFIVLQLGYYHGTNALRYFDDVDDKSVQRLSECIGRLNAQLSSAAQAAGYVQGSHIVREGLDGVRDAVSSLAEAVRDGFAELAAANLAGFEMLSNSVVRSGQTLASAVVQSGNNVAAAQFSAGSQVAAAIRGHGQQLEDGLSSAGRAISESVRSAGDRARDGMISAGTRIALGAVGAGVLHASILDDEFEKIASRLLPI
jgi:hypothetical protein